ncbi:MAG: tetratricopeptide repeat protein [Verrucomicrobia bacterium]|nr:tetratricopeptide repeat protein [Verrucomicrobiota bacterium]
MIRRSTAFLFLLLLFASCYRVPDQIDPRVSYQIQDQHFQKLTGAFEPLSHHERDSDWGREYIIARAFADQLDLYRAVSTFKRAEILVPKESVRKLEIQYDILLCYFLGKRYDEATEEFERSGLAHVDKSFPAYHDLLLVLYECYREMENFEKQQRIYELIQSTFPETAEKLRISAALRTGDLYEIEQINEGFQHPSYLDRLLDCYYANKKSVGGAQALNAILPGAGYLYIGQKKSALTAFLLNGLFIAAAYQFFHKGHTAAGIITLSFETGWYFGGIYGAGEEAKYYNERVYERNASAVLNDCKLFPVLMLQHAF